LEKCGRHERGCVTQIVHFEVRWRAGQGVEWASAEILLVVVGWTAGWVRIVAKKLMADGSGALCYSCDNLGGSGASAGGVVLSEAESSQRFDAGRVGSESSRRFRSSRVGSSRIGRTKSTGLAAVRAASAQSLFRFLFFPRAARFVCFLRRCWGGGSLFGGGGSTTSVSLGGGSSFRVEWGGAFAGG
jgi:hypothetical protein